MNFCFFSFMTLSPSLIRYEDLMNLPKNNRWLMKTVKAEDFLHQCWKTTKCRKYIKNVVNSSVVLNLNFWEEEVISWNSFHRYDFVIYHVTCNISFLRVSWSNHCWICGEVSKAILWSSLEKFSYYQSIIFCHYSIILDPMIAVSQGGGIHNKLWLLLEPSDYRCFTIRVDIIEVLSLIKHVKGGHNSTHKFSNQLTFLQLMNLKWDTVSFLHVQVIILNNQPFS